MGPFIRLSETRPQLSADTRLLKAGDYLLHESAQALLVEARAEAQTIRQQAQAAFEAEKARGYEEGMQQAKMDNIEQMMDSVGQAIDYFSQVEDKVAAIVMASVRKILGQFDDDELVAQVVRNALHLVSGEQQVKLHVSPELTESLKERLNPILAAHRRIGFVELVPDHRLQAGDCLLETEIGTVDASVEVQLKALEQALNSRIGSGPKNPV
jgi:type III secretion protein L